MNLSMRLEFDVDIVVEFNDLIFWVVFQVGEVMHRVVMVMLMQEF